MPTLRALSIRQPWADLCLPHDLDMGEGPPKSIETRRWPRPLRVQAEALVGTEIIIHAGKKMVEAALPLWRVYRPGEDPDSLPRGALLGTVKLVDAWRLKEVDEEFALCNCKGKFGLIFADAARFAEPIPYRGQLGFFCVPEETLQCA